MTFFDLYLLFLFLLTGAVMGSFCACLGGRLARGETMLGRSKCPDCGHVLAARDLIPVVSYLTHRGKCRYCGAPMAPWYLWTEVLSALSFAVLYWHLGFSPTLLQWLLVTCLCTTAAAADLEERIVPDSLVLTLLIVRAVFLFFRVAPSPLSSLLGALSVSVPLLALVLVMDKLLKKETMGGGDIKFFFAIGAYFTWQLNLLLLIVSCLVGLLFAFLGKKRGMAFPFIPAIAVSTILVMLCGQYFLHWYLSLFF